MPIPSTRPRISNSSPSRITASYLRYWVFGAYARGTARSVRPQHLEQLVDHRVVAEVAAARDRPQRRGVYPAVGDRGLVEVHADHLTDHEVLVGGSAVDIVQLDRVNHPALERARRGRDA